MNLLLDTHIIIWALCDDPRLPDAARKLILDPDNSIYYSAASVWEVSIKHSLHPEHVDFSGLELSVQCEEAGFLPLDIKERHVIALEDLEAPGQPPVHKDPFDRILIAQAKSERMKLLTHDSHIRQYPEKCVLWV